MGRVVLTILYSHIVIINFSMLRATGNHHSYTHTSASLFNEVARAEDKRLGIEIPADLGPGLQREIGKVLRLSGFQGWHEHVYVHMYKIYEI